MSRKNARNSKSDFDVLDECIKGKSLHDIRNISAVERFTTVGFLRGGTEVVHRADGRISLHKTVGTTELGKFAYRTR